MSGGAATAEGTLERSVVGRKQSGDASSVAVLDEPEWFGLGAGLILEHLKVIKSAVAFGKIKQNGVAAANDFGAILPLGSRCRDKVFCRRRPEEIRRCFGCDSPFLADTEGGCQNVLAEVNMGKVTKAASTVVRRTYTDEFKRDAVNLVVVEGYSFKRAADAVGVSSRSLREWHEKFAPAPDASADNPTVQQLQAEIQRLRKALQQAELERNILKKATAYFAKESQ